MKVYYFFALCLFLAACNQNSAEIKIIKARVDSLEKRVANNYKPGFGEFMSGIQVHHAKLWFAGTNSNWKLADFEVQEIMEALDDLQQFQPGRKETRSLPMLTPALDSVNAAIKQENTDAFKSSFLLLTNTCNNCHKEVNYSFNEVKIPDHPPFSNQEFKRKEK